MIITHFSDDYDLKGCILSDGIKDFKRSEAVNTKDASPRVPVCCCRIFNCVNNKQVAI